MLIFLNISSYKKKTTLHSNVSKLNEIVSAIFSLELRSIIYEKEKNQNIMKLLFVSGSLQYVANLLSDTKY